MNFRIGQKVVCIHGLNKGVVFTIQGNSECPNCHRRLSDVGLRFPYHGFKDEQCDRCHFYLLSTDILWFANEILRPIEYNSAQEELAEEFKQVEEKPDIIVEPQKHES